MEFVKNLKYLRQICNWKRDYKDDKDKFESSEESFDSQKGKKSDDDLLRNKQNTSDSMIEKEVTLSSEEDEDSYDPVPYENDEPPSPTIIRPEKKKKK